MSPLLYTNATQQSYFFAVSYKRNTFHRRIILRFVPYSCYLFHIFMDINIHILPVDMFQIQHHTSCRCSTCPLSCTLLPTDSYIFLLYPKRGTPSIGGLSFVLYLNFVICFGNYIQPYTTNILNYFYI